MVHYWVSRLRSELKRLRFAVISLVVIVTALALIAINQQRAIEGIPDLATVIAEVKDVKKIISVDGNLVGKRSREVYLVAGGEVKNVRVSVGTRVKANAVLATVEANQGLSSATETYNAPFAGVVTEVNYAVGDTVSPGLYGFRIVDDSEYRLEVGVNENDIIDLKVGQTATLIFPAVSLDEEFAGEVSHIDPAPVSTSGAVNYLTVIKPTELPQNIRLGMSVAADITAAQVDDVLAIPESFLIEKDDSLFVKRITWTNDQKTEYELNEVEVEIGLRTDELVEITSGLKAGDELVEPSFTENRGFGLFGN